MVMESILRTEVDTSWLEIRIERFLRFSVIAIKTMQLVIVYLERWKVTLWIDNLLFPFLDRIIQKSVADKVDESVLIHASRVVREHFWMLLDEADDVVVLPRRRLETAKAIGSDDELVTTNTSALAVQPYIRRIAQAVTSVQRVASVYQHILNTELVFEIVVGEFCHFVILNKSFYLVCPNPTPCSPAFSPASKALDANSCGESTPGLKYT